MANDLKTLNLSHVDQTNESDLNLLQRLVKQNGAEMAVKETAYLSLKPVLQEPIQVKIYLP